MKRYRIEFSPEAVRHVEAIAAWWTANRPAAPLLFADELRAALRQLQRAPHSGQPYAPPGVRPTRRLLLPKCAHHIYYAADDESGTVRVYAVCAHVPGAAAQSKVMPGQGTQESRAALRRRAASFGRAFQLASQLPERDQRAVARLSNSLAASQRLHCL